MGGKLEGQTAIVTGAGSAEGIGFAIARRLHHDGAFVAITSTTERIHERAHELDPNGLTVSAHIHDLTQQADVEQFVKNVYNATGRIDILVNNAGMSQTGLALSGRTVEESSFEDWQKQIAITLHSAFLMTHALLPFMRRQKYGRIVNVSSVTGPRVSNIGSGAYGAAKAGMDGMMRAIALEAGPLGITINAVAPGWITTASSTESELEAAKYTPLRRGGTPDEVAAAVCFLASCEASYVTGQSLIVDGGNILQENKGPR